MLATTKPGIEKRAERARKRSDKLFLDFANFRIYCQTIAEIFWPERANFTSDRTPGVDMQDGLFSGEPQVMRRDFGNRIGAAIRPPTRVWAQLSAEPVELQSVDAVRFWCERSTRIQRRIIYDRLANYTQTMAIGDQDYVTFGNAVSWGTYRSDGKGLVFKDCHLRSCAWSVNENGIVDELYEKMKLPLDQCDRMFGRDKLPREWRRRLEKDDGGLHEVEVIRCHFPCDPDQYDKGAKPMRQHKFCILYIVGDNSCKSGESKALSESFSEVFRYHVRRWMPLDEPFGRSMVTVVALADARTLNIAEMATLKSIEWQVDPPRWAEHEAVVGNIEMISGGLTYVDTSQWQGQRREPFGKMESGDPRHAMEYLKHKRDSMALAFYETLWKFPDREMTAFESAERLEMMVNEASPVFEPMEADNARQQDMVFELSAAKNAFPPPPQELLERGGRVDWEFETPVSVALKKLRAMRANEVVENVRQAREVHPTYGKHVNWDEMEREQLSGIGPENWILPRTVVAKQDALREQAMQDQETGDGMERAIDTALHAKPENLAMLEAE